MELEIVLFSTLSELTVPEISKLTDVEIKAPQGSTVIFDRKFIVLKNNDKVVIVIGPVFNGQNYLHQNLRSFFNQIFPDKRYHISGGGFLEHRAFFHHSGDIRWIAKFCGRSQDFGKFDSVINLFEENIQVQMKLANISITTIEE